MSTIVGNDAIANQLRQSEIALAEKTKEHASEALNLVSNRMHEASVAVANRTAVYATTAFTVAISTAGMKKGVHPTS